MLVNALFACVFLMLICVAYLNWLGGEVARMALAEMRRRGHCPSCWADKKVDRYGLLSRVTFALAWLGLRWTGWSEDEIVADMCHIFERRVGRHVEEDSRGDDDADDDGVR